MAHPFLKIGEVYYVDNPSAKSFVGRLTHIIDPFTVALEDASWVASSGYLTEFIRTGKADNMETEIAGSVITRYSAIMEWPHKLPKEAIR